MPKPQKPSTAASLHDRRLARRLEDPEFRVGFENATRQTRVIDAVVNDLDSLRTTHGISKAELARKIGKNPASVRRLFTAPANPELRTLVAIADALGADVVIEPRSPRGRRAQPPQPGRESG
jgi:DNA-binding phage protein